MNTKQFLYDTLKTQLNIKETECKQYDNNVYNPALIELKTEINRWFVDNVKATYSTFEFNGNEIYSYSHLSHQVLVSNSP